MNNAPEITIHGKLHFLDDGRLLSPMPLGNLRARAGVAEFIPLNGPEEEKGFLDLQRREPQQLSGIMWVYKDNIIRHDGGVGDLEQTILEIKHHILRQERDTKR